jgi:hypothetical protein
MNWKDYEIYITRHFKGLFPDAEITHNVRKRGVLSQTMRQIDILIEAAVVGFPISIVIDCKCFGKKVDVKDVESFLSFLGDLKASKGIMITNHGYSKAAYNRATYDTKDVELRIINFNDLEDFQAFCGIPFSRGHCAIVSAPDGWVLDAQPQGPYVASLYPTGLSQLEAFSNEGFMYIVFSHKDANWPNLEHLLATQAEGIRQSYKTPKVEYLPTISRDDCATRLRVIETSELEPRLDYTLFLDYPDVVVFLTLLAPHDRARLYLQKLEWVGEKLIKGNVIFDAAGKPLHMVGQS